MYHDNNDSKRVQRKPIAYFIFNMFQIILATRNLGCAFCSNSRALLSAKSCFVNRVEVSIKHNFCKLDIFIGFVYIRFGLYVI